MIVNDRLDVAIAAGAHGVHLPAEGIPSVRARGLVPPGFLVGRSVHNAGDVARETAAAFRAGSTMQSMTSRKD